MARILISGLINLETTLRVSGFPLAYEPVTYPFHGINTTVSGVGYNLARALTMLGHQVRFCSLIADDPAGRQVRAALAVAGLDDGSVLSAASATAQSVILYDPSGRRQIHTDLKDIQAQPYPADRFLQALEGCDVAVMCNINFSRALLPLARRAGRLVATDVHAISALDDDYNRDFMAAADILFMSHERLPMAPEAWARGIIDRYSPRMLVIGMGAEGALLAVPQDDTLVRLPALRDRPVVSTVGAGDALFAGFLHAHLQAKSPRDALQQAILFAGHKIGVASAGEGFLSADELEQLWQRRGSPP